MRRPSIDKSSSTSNEAQPVKKVQEKSDQQPASSANRFRVRSKTRGAAAAGATAAIGAGALATVSKDKKDKDGAKVGLTFF